MKLVFLGTRGEIDARTDRHGMHTSLEISYYGKRVMVDCGEDWLGEVENLNPHAIVLTHAHPDHAWGLKDGAPCPVYATEVTWESIDGYPIEDRVVVEPRQELEIEGMSFEAFEVEHSIRAPAVGYRVEAGPNAIFYVPDVAYIPERADALSGIDVYVGDGATIKRSMVRRQGDQIFGHAPISTQLTWCRKEGVPRAVITHCGSQVVEGDEKEITERVAALAEERGVEVEIAYDGLEVVLR